MGTDRGRPVEHERQFDGRGAESDHGRAGAVGVRPSGVVVQPAPVAASTLVTTTYEYTGTTDTFTVPDGVSAITVTLKGGQGGRGGYDSQGAPIPGGYQGVVTGVIAVTPGEVITVAVGSGGGTGNSSRGSAPGGYAGQNPRPEYSGARAARPVRKAARRRRRERCCVGAADRRRPRSWPAAPAATEATGSSIPSSGVAPKSRTRRDRTRRRPPGGPAWTPGPCAAWVSVATVERPVPAAAVQWAASTAPSSTAVTTPPSTSASAATRERTRRRDSPD